MKIIRKLICISVLILTLSACSTFMPEPTATPSPTATSVPTATNTPVPTSTPTQFPTEVPTETPIPPTETPDGPPVLPMPVGEPLNEWEGFPIMLDAIAGEGDSTGYSFIIAATSDEVQEFYETELQKLGWELMAVGEGSTGALLVIFTQDPKMLTVSIIPQVDGIMYVMLVKSYP